MLFSKKRKKSCNLVENEIDIFTIYKKIFLTTLINNLINKTKFFVDIYIIYNCSNTLKRLFVCLLFSKTLNLAEIHSLHYHPFAIKFK